MKHSTSSRCMILSVLGTWIEILNQGGGGGDTHPTLWPVVMCCGKVKNGGLRNGWSVKMGVSGTNIGHPATDFVGIRGVSGTRYCEKCACVARG